MYSLHLTVPVNIYVGVTKDTVEHADETGDRITDDDEHIDVNKGYIYISIYNICYIYIYISD